MYYTENLGLQVPEQDDAYNIDYVEHNAKILDKSINNINIDSQNEFNRYYGLIASDTEFLEDGSIKTTNSEATILTVFGTNDEGQKTITETITLLDGSSTYTKTTTIIPATDSTNKMIREEYTAE
jgi:hypothetical protein